MKYAKEYDYLAYSWIRCTKILFNYLAVHCSLIFCRHFVRKFIFNRLKELKLNLIGFKLKLKDSLIEEKRIYIPRKQD